MVFAIISALKDVSEYWEVANVVSYPGIQVMMMMMTPSVTIGPDDVQAEIYCGFVTKCMKHIPRDSSLIQQWPLTVRGIGSFAVKGGNQWVEASTGHVRIKGLKLLAVVCSPLRTQTNTSPRVSTKDDENRKQEN